MPKFHVERAIEIHAPPQQVYDRVADFGGWTAWSPWLCAEPDAEVRVSEPTSEIDSTYSWSGEVVGAGEIKHIQLQPGKHILDEITFLKPYKSVSTVRFDFVPAGEGTRVTWHMDGSLPWFMFWMKSAVEGFVGMDYERGLKMLKELIETGAVPSRTIVQGVQSMGPIRMAGVRKTCSFDEIGPVMDVALSEATDKLQQHGLSTDGERMAVYHRFDLKAKQFEFTGGNMLMDLDAQLPEELAQWSMPKLDCFRVDHLGSYQHLGNAWSAANQHAHFKKMKQSKIGAFELYKNDPATTPCEHLCTEIYLPLK